MNCRRLGPDEQPSIEAFYRECGYDSPLDSSDKILIAEENGKIEAGLRICHEGGVLVLRGMYVREELRGRGIGSRLLRFTDSEIASDTCYCIPFANLESFYEMAGFLRIDPEQAPTFLRQRLDLYLDSLKLDVILMRRSGAAHHEDSERTGP